MTHMRDAAATIATGIESKDIFKVKGKKDYHSGTIRDDSRTDRKSIYSGRLHRLERNRNKA